jgi:hypothetical protein
MFEAIDVLLFVLPLLISALSLAAMHWFPWHGGARPLGRIAAYSAGTTVVVGVPVLTMLLAATLGMHRLEWFWATLLVANTAVSGGTVSLAYWIDSRRALTLEDDRAASRS